MAKNVFRAQKANFPVWNLRIIVNRSDAWDDTLLNAFDQMAPKGSRKGKSRESRISTTESWRRVFFMQMQILRNA